jgi:hypothetical protein
MFVSAGISSRSNESSVRGGARMSNHRPRVKSFSGGAPKTDDHIVMTQVRYYPF